MKKAKTFAILGATALSLGILSTSIAMYIKTPDDKSISIGATYQTDGNYTLTNTSETGTLSPDEDVTIKATLGLNAEETYTQSSVVGKISVNFTFANETFANSVDVSAEVTGYDTGNYFASNNTLTFATSGTTISSDFTTAFAVNGAETLEITVSLKDTVTDTTFINSLAELEYSYTIALTEPDETFDYAYVVGTVNNWTVTSEYQMVPSLDSWDTTWTWKYEGLIPSDGDQLKARMGKTEDWSANETGSSTNYVVNISWLESDEGGNYDSTKGLVIRWSGSTNDTIDVDCL